MANILAQGQLILQDENLGILHKDENLGILHKGASVNGKAKNFKEPKKKGAQGLGHRKALNDISNSSRLRQEASSKKNNNLEEFNIDDQMWLHDHSKCVELQTAAMDRYLYMERVFSDLDYLRLHLQSPKHQRLVLVVLPGLWS
ncbi:protein PATRONUS 2-like [Telopea speciosissima]|uniref:protein PATRONUS 2-like n=1 Tax=Telopea speciosissima TaxID=54955 RepID=UPI001CC5F20B|nr:protein PATRONUS 2-like [Telopea speciosissima]